jgi:transcription elongation factor GreA
MKISSEGLEKIKKELQELKTKRRGEVSEKLKRAIEMGDLSENAEYDAAKNEQGFLESRISELEKAIKESVVSGGDADGSGIVGFGSTVVVDCGGGPESYTIVGSVEVDPLRGKISVDSPLGLSLAGKKKGDKFDMQVGTQKTACKIIDIKC